MLFKRNTEQDDDTLDYDVPMENEPDNEPEGQRMHGYNPQAKINAMQNVINKQNVHIGSLYGQMAGFKVLRQKYDTLLREKIELEYKVKELGMQIEQLNNALNASHEKRTEDSVMLGYALKMHPDFLEWYTKEVNQERINSYEAQIEILKAKMAGLKGA